MDKFKRWYADRRHILLFTIEVSVLIVGAFIGFITVYRFAILARAVLGLTIGYFVYLEYVVFRRTHDNASFFIKFEFPKDVKYFVLDFVLMIIMAWSSVQVLDLIRYLIHIFINR